MSINERKHPQVRETVLQLEESQQEALKALRAAIEDGEAFTDFALNRFLSYNSYDVPATAKQWGEYIAYRKENKLDELTQKPSKAYEVISVVCPYSYREQDKDGRPIYWEKTGKIKAEALADEKIVNVQDFLDSHVWGMEHLYEQCHQKSLERGQRVDQFTSVVDMDGIGFQHRSALFVLKACMDFDNKYYPDRIGKLYVLNTPWLAPALYQIVMPVLPASFKEKIFVVQGKPDEFLLKHIEARIVPKEYGGEAEDIEEKDATELLQNSQGSSDGLDQETIRYEFIKELECDEKGGTFTWFFESEGGYDIDFSVAIIDLADPSKEPIMAKQPSRCVTSKGSYEATKAEKVVFKWDNNFSYFANKTIKYNVCLAPKAEMDELDVFLHRKD